MTITSHIRFIQQFDWTSEDNKHHISFAVTDMLNALKQGTLPFATATVPIDATFAETWCKLRIDNEYYCRNMSQAQMDRPVLGVWMPDETVLLIDGSHRYMARYWHSLPTIDYVLIAEGWQRFAKETKL